MPTHKLDAIDRMILTELQADGRMTNVELASRVGISAPPCLRRVRSLEEQGFIRGYHASVDARELGFEVQVFAMVGLQSQAEADLTAFEKRCNEWPLVRECHMLNGEVDFILKCVAPDLSTFQRFLTEELTAAPNVIRSSASHRSAGGLLHGPQPGFISSTPCPASVTIFTVPLLASLEIASCASNRPTIAGAKRTVITRSVRGETFAPSGVTV